MNFNVSEIARAAVMPVLLVLAACSGGGWDPKSNVSTYTVGGTVNGLAGTVVLQNNAGDNLTVSANGPFAFAASVAAGSQYSVTVLSQPSNQFCSVVGGTGTIAQGSISDVTINCANVYTVGGSVTGLNGTLTLQNNGADNLTINANGTFSFTTPIVDGSSYNVTILTPPVSQPCTLTYGASTVSGANVTNVDVICGPMFVGGFSATGSPASPLGITTMLQDGRVLALRGDGTAELYDPVAGTWSATGRLITARAAFAKLLLPSGKVLVAGGRVGAAVVANAELYDPASGTWAATASLATARSDPSATLLPNGKVLIAGGFGGTTSLASSELYDPATGTWETVGNMTTARSGSAAKLLPNGKVLVAGGASNTSAELFDPATGTWAATGSMATARSTLILTLLPNGRVLVSGGSTSFGNALAVSEIYDPAAGIWSAAASMNFPRFAHTATLLPNGKVLVAGGSTLAGITIYSSSELYDPASDTWATAGTMTIERRNHAAVRLLDGKVLVSGGLGYSGVFTTSADLFW